MVFANQTAQQRTSVSEYWENYSEILLPHTFRPPSPLVESLDTNFECVTAPPQLGGPGLAAAYLNNIHILHMIGSFVLCRSKNSVLFSYSMDINTQRLNNVHKTIQRITIKLSQVPNASQGW